MMKHFFDTDSKNEIIDVSGQKSIEDIKNQFGGKNYIETRIDEKTETIIFLNDLPIKKVLKKDSQK